MKNVAVLFCRKDSIYKHLGVDCWDESRDATRYAGAAPVVAHPPCRSWGRLRTFSKPVEGEQDLARFAVRKVRENGGVLEHPASSTLWQDQNLPRPGCGKDAHGGWTLGIHQHCFGHEAEKATWLYIVGVEAGQLPSLPLILGSAERLVENMGRKQREATPPDLAMWLIELADTINTVREFQTMKVINGGR